MSLHRNEIGLSVLNPDYQSYYLIPFANLEDYFLFLSVVLPDVLKIRIEVYKYISTYNPKTEIVLLVLKDGSAIVKIVER
jgi:hypothetical protein